MPNLLAHNFLANRLFNEASIQPNFEDSFLYNNLDFLRAGAQGPDPLFFTGIVIRNGLHVITALKNYGRKIHRSNGRLFFEKFCEIVYRVDDLDRLNQLKSYILGQVSHYLLDTTCHPYIYYQSGFDKDGKLTKNYHYLHANYETTIDLNLAKRFNILSFFDKPETQLVTNETTHWKIDPWIIEVLKNMYDVKKLPKNLYSNGVKNLSHYWKVMNSKIGGIKKLFYPKSVAISGYRFPKKYDSSCLNDSRSYWYDPETKEKHNESFLDLFEIAYQKTFECYLKLNNGEFNSMTIFDYLDKDYSGCSVNGVKKYNKKNMEEKGDIQ